ncbi:MAG: aminoglycoside phosphotransferase family protein [Proteobacteria bacterium]|nr:aminoglycoside phosphotransferase family protein [Pseudomonadota bacterium]
MDSMRSASWVSLDVGSVQALLAEVLPQARVTALQELRDGYCNTNYKVCVEGPVDALVLRVFTMGQRSPRRQLALMQRVCGQVPVPRVLHFAESHALLSFPYAFMSFLEGRHLHRILPGQAEAGQRGVGLAVGRALAAIGETEFESTGLFDETLQMPRAFASVGELWQTIIGNALFHGRVGRRLGEEGARRLWSVVETNKPLLDALPQSRRLVHADYNSKNILVCERDGAWEVSGVLDWECAYAGSPLADIANLFNYMGNPPPAFERGVLDGFVEAGGDLPAEWRRVTRLLDLISIIEFLNQPGERPQQFEEAKRQLSHSMRMLEQALPGS